MNAEADPGAPSDGSSTAPLDRLISDGGTLRTPPKLALRNLDKDDSITLAEVLWGVSVWLAIPYTASQQVRLTEEGFQLHDAPISTLAERAQETGLAALLVRLGGKVRREWPQPLPAVGSAPVAPWGSVALDSMGMLRFGEAATQTTCDRATAQLYEHVLVQECGLMDVTIAPILKGLWGCGLQGQADALAEEFTDEDAGQLRRWICEAGEVYARGLKPAAAAVTRAPYYLPEREALSDGRLPSADSQIEPSFALPLGLRGFHSGWIDDEDHNPMDALGLAPRRLVRLRGVHDTFVYWSSAAWQDGALPLLVKHPQGAYLGVSSGAGGALVPFANRVLKLKRCGYKYLGFQAQASRIRTMSIRERQIYESSYEGVMGLAEVEDLLMEQKAADELVLVGIRPASIPRLLLQTAQFMTHPESGSLISEIVTDVRADEVLLLAMTDPQRSAQSGAEQRLHSGVADEAVHELGLAIGSVYRRLHDERVVRGVGNSWYGNDALCADGNIALCDLETLATDRQIGGCTHRLLMELDLHLFRTGVYVSCSLLSKTHTHANMYAEMFLQAFLAGYRSRAVMTAPTAAAYVAGKLKERSSGQPDLLTPGASAI